MPKLRTALAGNTTKTYRYRGRQLDLRTEQTVIDSFRAFIESKPKPPIGTALPTRATALRRIIALRKAEGKPHSQEEVSNLLASVDGLKAKSMRFALAPDQLEAYYAAVARLYDVEGADAKLKVALALLPQTGLRPDEMCKLKVLHVRAGAKGFQLEVHGKSQEARLVPVRGFGATLLRSYLKTVKGEWLFPGKTGPMNVQCIQHAVAGYTSRGKRYPGISDIIDEPRLTPYVLRHTYATSLLEQGEKMQTIAKLMGHSSTQTTEQYLHLVDGETEAAIERLAPKAWPSSRQP